MHKVYAGAILLAVEAKSVLDFLRAEGYPEARIENLRLVRWNVWQA